MRCLRTGYRSIPLKNIYSEDLELASLLVHIKCISSSVRRNLRVTLYNITYILIKIYRIQLKKKFLFILYRDIMHKINRQKIKSILYSVCNMKYSICNLIKVLISA